MVLAQLHSFADDANIIIVKINITLLTPFFSQVSFCYPLLIVTYDYEHSRQTARLLGGRGLAAHGGGVVVLQ